jgi:hypothetical protein
MDQAAADRTGKAGTGGPGLAARNPQLGNHPKFRNKRSTIRAEYGLMVLSRA